MSKTIKYLIQIGIATIPFTSLLVLPSFYRPVSIYFIILAGIFILLGAPGKIKYASKDIVLLIVFVIISFFHSLIWATKTNGYVNFLIAWSLLFIGVFSYAVLKYYVKRIHLDNILILIAKVYYFIIAIGIIEILSFLGILPQEVKIWIGYIFSGEVSGRIQLVTSEPAWASKIIIFVLPVYLYLYQKYGRKKYLYAFLLSLLLLIFTFSILGYFIFLFSALLFIIFKKKEIKISKSLIKRFSFLILAFIISFSIIKRSTNIDSNNYFSNRLTKISTIENLSTFMFIDNSVFIRTSYPLIGFLIFWDHPLGVGMGQSGYYFHEYISKFNHDYQSSPEIIQDLETNSAEPKSFYSKLLAEHGILSGVFMWFFLIFSFSSLKKKLKNSNKNLSNFYLLNFIVALVTIIQTGSFLYLPFWFAMAINNSKIISNN